MNLISPAHFLPKNRLIIELNNKLTELIEAGVTSEDSDLFEITIQGNFSKDICTRVATDYMNSGWLNINFKNDEKARIMVWHFYK